MKNDWTSGFKEIVTALIGLAIVAIACWAVLGTLGTAQREVQVQAQDLLPENKELLAHRVAQFDASFGRQKDIMQYALSLLGVVLGYYFGRMPAERRAEHAEAAAEDAQKVVTTTVQDASEARQTAIQATSDKKASEQKLANVTTEIKQIEPLLQPVVEAQRKTLSTATPDPAAMKLIEVHHRLQSLLQRI